MSLLVLLKNRANGQPVIADDDDNEWLNIINALSGISTNISIRVRSDDNNFAVARFDQLGTNDILELFLAGTEVAKFDNNGNLIINHGANPFVLINNTDGGTGLKLEVVDADTANIVSEGIGNIATINLTTREITFVVIPTNVIKHKETWFNQDPNAPGGTEFLKVFIAPSGTAMKMTKLSIIRVGGGHAGGSTCTFQFNLNGAGVVGTVAFSDANNAGNTEYSVALNQVLAAGDRINPTVNPNPAFGVNERDITVLLEWEEKLT